MPPKITTEIKKLVALALPLMLSEFVDASFGFSTTLFSAHLGIIELAAAAVVNSLFFTIIVFMWGVLISVSNLVAERHGADDKVGIAGVLKDGLILAAGLSVPAMLIIWNLSHILLFLGQKPEMVKMATRYLHALTWATLPSFLSVVLLQFVIGLGKTRIPLLFNAFKVPMTLLTSYVLMFGKLHMPRLGLEGLGWGISIGMWFGTLLLLLYVFSERYLRQYLVGHYRTTKRYIGKILTMGLPIAGMFCIEVGFFTVVALVMGKIGSVELAANQIAGQYTGFFTMIISFVYSQAVSVRMGYILGQKNLSSAKTIVHAGILIVTSLMVLVACCYWFFPHRLIAADLNPLAPQNKIIVHYATQFLFLAAFFQIFESARLVLFGALRGLGQTHFSMITSIITFWIISFPIGYILTFWLKVGPMGMWLGMVVGPIFGVVLLYRRLQRQL